MTANETTRRAFLAGLAVASLPVACGSPSTRAQSGKVRPDETMQAFLDRVADQPAVPVTRWHNERAWGANLGPALRAAVEAIKSGEVPAGKVSIPYRQGGWQLSSQAVLDASWALYLLEGSIRLTSDRAQHGLFVTADPTSKVNHAFLRNVAIIGNGKVTIDGNADRIHYSEPVNPVDAPAYAALRCVRVKGLYVTGVHVTNGVMDSMSVKQCPDHLIEDVEFSRARYDNGFSATTDLEGYAESDRSTWGGGTLRRFKAHHNNDFGATSYNCSGQNIVQGDAWGNRGGISYERGFRIKDGSKSYHGTIDAVSCYDNRVRGIYVDGSGVTIGDKVRTWGNGGTDQDDPNFLTGYGVVVSGVRDAYVGGEHVRNETGGVLLTNASGIPMSVVLSAKCNDNGRVGCYARALHRLEIRPGAEFDRNGLADDQDTGSSPRGRGQGRGRPPFSGHGLFAVTNNRGERAMFKKGTVLINAAQFSCNTSRAIQVDGYDSVVLNGVRGSGNLAGKGALEAAASVKLENLSSARIDGLSLDSPAVRGRAVLEIGRGVGSINQRNVQGAGAGAVILDRRGI